MSQLPRILVIKFDIATMKILGLKIKNLSETASKHLFSKPWVATFATDAQCFFWCQNSDFLLSVVTWQFWQDFASCDNLVEQTVCAL